MRLEIARSRGVPPYVIFHDATLREMARLQPTSLNAFLAVKGVGARKAEDLGETFLAVIRGCPIFRLKPEATGHSGAAMRPKTIYLWLGVLGTVLPYWQFLPFLRESGLDLQLFVEQMFANPVSGFFALDVVVSSLVLWVLVAASRGAGRA